MAAFQRTPPLGGRYCTSAAAGGYPFSIFRASIGPKFEVPGSWVPASRRK